MGIIGDEGATELVEEELTYTYVGSNVCLYLCMRVRSRSSFSRVLNLRASWGPTRIQVDFLARGSSCRLFPLPAYTLSTMSPAIPFHFNHLSSTLYLALPAYTPPYSSLMNSPRIITFCHCL